jgi:uncharacterized protein (TIGR03000 family)
MTPQCLPPAALLAATLAAGLSGAQGLTRMPVGPAEPPAPAELTVSVPPGAELWFDRYKATQGGLTRYFETPPLPREREYDYDVRLRWPGGEWSGRLSVRAGQTLKVELPPPGGAKEGAP